MVQKRKTIDEIRTLLDSIQFMDWKLRLMEKGDGFLVQWIFMDIDVDNPAAGPVPQHCRKWYISPYSTDTEIVETAWKACKIAMEHEVREKFTFRGRRIYSPHFDVDARVAMCDNAEYDIRED